MTCIFHFMLYQHRDFSTRYTSILHGTQKQDRFFLCLILRLIYSFLFCCINMENHSLIIRNIVIQTNRTECRLYHGYFEWPVFFTLCCGSTEISPRVTNFIVNKKQKKIVILLCLIWRFKYFFPFYCVNRDNDSLKINNII